MGFVIWAVESTIRQNFGPDFRRETDAGQSIAITMGAFSLLRVFVVAYGTFARWIMDLQIARLHRDGSDSNDPLLAAPAGPYNLSAQQSNANIEMGPMRMQQPQSVAGQATAGVAGPTPGANVAPPMAFPARPNGAAPEQQPGHGLFQQFPTDQQHLYHQQGLYHQQQQQYNPHPYNPHPYQMQRSQQTEPASPLMVVPLAFNLLGQAIGDRVRRRPFR